jgi:transposase-like protein
MRQATCPSCEYSRAWKLRRKKYKCKRCKKEFSAVQYPVEGFRINEEAWKKTIFVFLRERSSLRISEEINIGLKTVQRMLTYLRIKMEKDIPEKFSGPVEMDETYIGGQRKNKRLHIRRIQAKKGHGTDKLPIVGLFCRSSGKVLVVVEPRKLDVQFIFRLIQKYVVPKASVYTDGFKMYRGLSSKGYRNEFVDHAGGELVRGSIHTNNMEGFWGILKRKLGCIGGMRRSRLHLFVAEIVWKFNHRNLSLKEQEEKLQELILRN